jgi:hypothetical protein
MSRASLDVHPPAWIRIGRGRFWASALVVLGLSVGIALFIAAPMTQFGPVLLGRSIPWIIGYLVSIVVVAILIAPLLLPRATRAVYVDRSFSRLRVGLRARSVSEIGHAYRLPDGLADGRFQLRLALPGIDALVGVSSKLPAELSTDEFDALIALVERTSIEPDPAATLRPPLGDELGERTPAEVFSDDLARGLLAHETMSFAKPTLLAELHSIRAALEGTGTGVGTAVVRDIGLVVPYTTNAPVQQATVAEATAIGETGPKRGFFGTLSASYRAELANAETWLESHGEPSRPNSPTTVARWGIVVLVVGLAAPWLSLGIMVASIIGGPLGASLDLGAAGGGVAFAFLTWPFIAWAGIVLNWSGRNRRFESIRSRAFSARARGHDIPSEIAGLFAPRFADVAYLNHLLIFLIFQTIVLLAGGLTMFSASMGQVENWGPSAFAAIIGIVMAVASVPVFTFAVQVIARFGTRYVRAVAMWRAIASPTAN